MDSKSYTLKKMLWAPPLVIIFFAMAAQFFYESAVRGRTINLYGIDISGLASALIFWLLFAFAVGFVLLGVFIFYGVLQGRRVVVLSSASIIVPKFSFGGVRHIEIPFSSIWRLELFQAGNGLFLNIHHSDGKSTLPKAAFQSESDFQNIHDALLVKTNDYI